MKVLLEKCFAPGKPQIKKHSNDILYLLFEKSDQTIIIESLNTHLSNKN